MDIEKIDEKSRELLKYLNTNSNLSYTTLATAFNQHYRNHLQEAMSILLYLQSKSLVKVKSDNDEQAILIQVTHAGRTYEQSLLEKERERIIKLWSDRCWNIVTLILSAIISVLVNLYMK